MLPQAQSIFATEIREALLKDGRVSLVAGPETADVVLRVSLAVSAVTVSRKNGPSPYHRIPRSGYSTPS